jgi:hypothetical protein
MTSQPTCRAGSPQLGVSGAQFHSGRMFGVADLPPFTSTARHERPAWSLARDKDWTRFYHASGNPGLLPVPGPTPVAAKTLGISGLRCYSASAGDQHTGNSASGVTLDVHPRPDAPSTVTATLMPGTCDFYILPRRTASASGRSLSHFVDSGAKTAPAVGSINFGSRTETIPVLLRIGCSYSYHRALMLTAGASFPEVLRPAPVRTRRLR